MYDNYLYDINYNSQNVLLLNLNRLPPEKKVTIFIYFSSYNKIYQ